MSAYTTSILTKSSLLLQRREHRVSLSETRIKLAAEAVYAKIIEEQAITADKITAIKAHIFSLRTEIDEKKSAQKDIERSCMAALNHLSDTLSSLKLDRVVIPPEFSDLPVVLKKVTSALADFYARISSVELRIIQEEIEALQIKQLGTELFKVHKEIKDAKTQLQILESKCETSTTNIGVAHFEANRYAVEATEFTNRLEPQRQAAQKAEAKLAYYQHPALEWIDGRVFTAKEKQQAIANLYANLAQEGHLSSGVRSALGILFK